jgi:acetyl-CoA acetyltransferase
MAAEDVWVLGIHMTKFGKHPDLDLVDLASEAVLGALADGDVEMKDIGVIGAGNLMGAAAGIGQQLQKQVGQTGIPVYNVANACATGATALRVAIMAIKAGETDMGLAFGVEKLSGAGLLSGGARKEDSATWTPSGRLGAIAPVDGRIGTETMPGVFAQIGMEYGHRYGGTSFDGAAAAVVVSGSKLKTLSLEQQRRAVKISASVLTTDPWEESCQVLPDVSTLTRNAARQAYEQAGIGPSDLDLVELHDCFATAELVHYDNLMLCEQGGAVDFFNSGATWRDGTLPVNVSGGLESKGHPIAATGIANVWEVSTHLRGEAGDRQIEGARVGLTHVIGLGSACGIHILEKAA